MLLMACFVVLPLSFLILMRDNKSNDKHCTCQDLGTLTYKHFMKATNDYDMKRFLIANYQDPKNFEGLSRRTIYEKMKIKAQITGREYTRLPY